MNEPKNRDNVSSPICFDISFLPGVASSTTILVSLPKVFWVELCPAPTQIHVEILTFSTLECDLIWRQDLYRDNQVKMRVFGRLSFNMTGILVKGEI